MISLGKLLILICVAAISLSYLGCSAPRPKAAMLEPTYSFVREGVKLANRSHEDVLSRNLRFAEGEKLKEEIKEN